MADAAGRSYRVRERARDTIRFEDDLRRRIIAKAEADGSSQNEVVNQLCQRALDADVLGKGDVPTLMQQVLTMLQDVLTTQEVVLHLQAYFAGALPVDWFNNADTAAGWQVVENAREVVRGG